MFKKLFTFILIFLLVFSLVRATMGVEPLQLQTVVVGLSNLSFDVEPLVDCLQNITEYASEAKPAPFPAYGTAESIGEWFTSAFEWLFYIIDMVFAFIFFPVVELLVYFGNLILSVVEFVLMLFGFEVRLRVA